jgi:uncharacterized protein (DUF302 family)
MINYGYVKESEKAFDEVCAGLPEALQKEGFGVLSKIDLSEKFKEKLGIEFQKYMLFGVCNPPLAHKALTAEINLGLMLPCNAVVYERDGKAVLAVIRPTVAMSMIENESLAPVAEEVERKLKAVFDAAA